MPSDLTSRSSLKRNIRLLESGLLENDFFFVSEVIGNGKTEIYYKVAL